MSLYLGRYLFGRAKRRVEVESMQTEQMLSWALRIFDRRNENVWLSA